MAQDKNTKHHNDVRLDRDGIIWITYRGEQDREAVASKSEELYSLIASRRSLGEKVFVIADLRAVTHADSGARNESKKFLDTDYDALAIIGNKYLGQIVQLVLQTKQLREKVAYFSSEHEALSWLQDKKKGNQHHAKKYAAQHGIKKLLPKSLLLWGITLAFLFTIFSTVASTIQAQQHLEEITEGDFNQLTLKTSEAIKDRITAYTNALNSTRGLFHSSDSVNEGEYHAYFDSLDLTVNYPGFQGITYIEHVTDAQLPAYTQRVRSDSSFIAGGNPSFTPILSEGSSDHFLITYIGSPSSNGQRGRGIDYAGDPDRGPVAVAARDQGKAVSTETLSLFDAQGKASSNRGFLVMLPVYKDAVPDNLAERRAQHEGFIAAVFNYQNFFSAVVSDLPKDAAIAIKDAEGTTVYRQGTAGDEEQLRKTVAIPVANRTIAMEMSVPTHYGTTPAEQNIPKAYSVGGALFCGLLLILFWSQNRSRKQALQLADAMTEDLQQERNEAVAVRNKDEAILSSIGDGVIALDGQGRVIVFNQAAEKMSGYSAEEVLGKHYTENLAFRDATGQKKQEAFIQRAQSGHNATMMQHTTLVQKSGKLLPVADSAAPIKDARGQHQGVIIVFRDVTQEEALNRAKDEFLSIVSHQLRTPLTAIRLFTEMLTKGQVGKLAAQQKDYIDKIDLSAKRMIKLVSDILNISRVELGRVRIQPEPADVNKLIRSRIDEMLPLALQRNAKISFKADTSIGSVNIDENVFGQVIHNLLTNAIRYAKPEAGKITVGFAATAQGYVLSVSDNGIGIPEAVKPRIFQRFFRADNAIKAEGEGTGLGLYLIKIIADSVHGKIWFESTEGKGSTFYFQLPLKGMTAKQGDKSLT